MITRTELQRLGSKSEPNQLVVKLDGYTEKMTPSTYDAFNAIKTALAKPETKQSALDILAGKVAVKRSLPAWYPANYDLAAAARAVRAMLIEQGERAETIGPDRADHFVFTDADLTLIKSTTPVLMKNAEGELLRHPETGRLMLLGTGRTRNWSDELGEMKALYPQIAWRDYAPEFSEFSSLSDILRSEEVREAMLALRASDENPRSRDFVITARSAQRIAAFLDEYLAIRGVDINGVFPVSAPELIRKLDLGADHLDAPRRKAITMAALITLYETIKSADFRDDSDENLIAAMELLPQMFPDIDFRFYDVLNEDGRDVFDHRLVAETTGGGELVDERGRPLSRAKIAAYNSKDHYPLDPVFT